MKFFLDTEFSERGPRYPIQLISIGMVSEHGKTLYVESSEVDYGSCNSWVRENVLSRTVGPRYSLDRIKRDVIEFVGVEVPAFWGYYSDYDWVVFCQIFGTMMDLPHGWPMYCNDIKQLCKSMGNPQLPPQDDKNMHHALADATWNKKAYEYLVQYGRERGMLIHA